MSDDIRVDPAGRGSGRRKRRRRRLSQRTSSTMTTAGGLLAVCGGGVHVVASVLLRRDVWSQMIDDGLYRAVTLEPSAEQLPVAEAFWFSWGSFGIPLLLLGSFVTWTAQRRQRVPSALGLGVAAWALGVGLLGGFDAGTFTLLLIGGLLVMGDQGHDVGRA